MELNKSVGDRNRVVRAVLAVVLAVVAIGSLRNGKRLSGALAGVGALALGYDAMTGIGGPAEAFDVGATGEDAALRCAACGEPIRPGERRRPNEDGETVHEACLESAA